MTSSEMDEGSDSEMEEYEIGAHDIVPEITTLYGGNYGPKITPNASKTTTAKKIVAKVQRQR